MLVNIQVTEFLWGVTLDVSFKQHLIAVSPNTTMKRIEAPEQKQTKKVNLQCLFIIEISSENLRTIIIVSSFIFS